MTVNAPNRSTFGIKGNSDSEGREGSQRPLLSAAELWGLISKIIHPSGRMGIAEALVSMASSLTSGRH